MQKITILCRNLLQEAQLMLANLHDAFRGQSKSPNMLPITISYVRYDFLLCCGKFVLRRTVFHIHIKFKTRAKHDYIEQTKL